MFTAPKHLPVALAVAAVCLRGVAFAVSPSSTAVPTAWTVDNTWAVYDQSGDIDSTVPQPVIDLLFRNPVDGSLYLRLPTTTNLTGAPTDAISIFNAWNNGSPYSNVATQGTRDPGGDSRPNKDIVTYWKYVRLQQNGSGIVGIDLFTPLGSTTFYNDATQIVTAWDVYTNVGFMPYATAAACIGRVDAGFANIDLTNTPFKVDPAQFDVTGITDIGAVDAWSNQYINLHAGGGCGFAGPIYSNFYQEFPVTTSPPSKRYMLLQVLLLPWPSSSATATPSPTGTAAATASSTGAPTASHTAAATPSGTAAITPSGTAAATPSHTAAVTPSTTAAGTPSATAAATPSGTAAITPSGTAAATPSHTSAATPSTSAAGTPSGTAVATPAATSSPSASVTPSGSAAASPSPTTAVSVAPSASHAGEPTCSGRGGDGGDGGGVTRTPAATRAAEASPSAACDATRTATVSRTKQNIRGSAAATVVPSPSQARDGGRGGGDGGGDRDIATAISAIAAAIARLAGGRRDN